MAYIKEEEINAIRQSADIVDIISSYLSVSKKGRNFVAVCPFHDDHSPSLVISQEKQIFNCFTCRTAGNVFRFVMLYENVDFITAVKTVAEKIGYHLEIDASSNKTNDFEKELGLMDLAKKYFVNNINTSMGSDAKEYLAKRGITEDIIKEFEIGLALPNKDNLYQILVNKNYSLEDIESLGLVNKYGLNVYDTFQNRIMIPITNLNGAVVGFTGRIFHQEDMAKYLNTKETKIFKKGHILFNYHNALRYIKEQRQVIIVEGNMDAIKVSASGIKNVIALMGVALSSEQIMVLKKLRVPIILMLDNDAAGLDATVKLGELLEKSGLEVLVVRLSGAKDPDEYIEAFGVPAFEEVIKHALKFLDFKLEYLKQNKDLHNMEDLIKYLKEVIESVKDKDDLTKEVIITKISKDYEVDASVLRKALGKENNSSSHLPPVEVQVPQKKSRYSLATDKILFGMMDNPAYISIYKNRLGYFKEKIERMLASEIVYYNNEHGSINAADFTNFIRDSKELYEKVNFLVSSNIERGITEEEFNNCIDIVLDEYLKSEIREIKEKIKNELDVNKKIALIAKLTELKKGSVENEGN